MPSLERGRFDNLQIELCDLRIVASRAKIGANFARLGIHPGLDVARHVAMETRRDPLGG